MAWKFFTNAGAEKVSPGANELAYAQVTANTALTATTEGTAHVVVTAPAIVCDGATTILIEFFAPQKFHSSATGRIFTVIHDSVAGAAIGILTAGQQGAALGDIDGPLYGAYRFTPAAGTRTFSIRAYTNASTGTISAGVGGAGASVPAYIRITRV